MRAGLLWAIGSVLLTACVSEHEEGIAAPDLSVDAAAQPETSDMAMAPDLALPHVDAGADAAPPDEGPASPGATQPEPDEGLSAPDMAAPDMRLSEGTPDATPSDAETPDAASPDATSTDMASPDAELPDMDAPDAAMELPDEGVADSDQGAPQPLAPPAAPCLEDEDCGEGETCASSAESSRLYPDGVCQRPCAAHADCGAGGVCLTTDFDLSLCAARCGPEQGCREGWACASPMAGPSYCVPDCRVTGCGPVGQCDQLTGQCAGHPDYGRAQLGGGCQSELECGYGVECCESWGFGDDPIFPMCTGHRFPQRPAEGEQRRGQCDPDPWYHFVGEARPSCSAGLICDGASENGGCFCVADFEHCFWLGVLEGGWCDPVSGRLYTAAE